MTAESDAFSVQLLEESKRFLEKAADAQGREAFLHAALIVAFSALESHVNGIAEELAERKGVSLVEQSLLTESSIKFSKGEFVLAETKYFRLEDRIAYLFRKHAGSALGEHLWWSDLSSGIDARNKLVHPRDEVKLSVVDVERYLKAIVEALNDLYRAVFGRGHPSYGRGLQSTMTF